MSRVAKAPVTVPNGVTVTQNGRQVEVKGTKGTLSFNLHALVELKQEEGKLQLAPVKESKDAWMQAGTARAVLNNLVKGVSEGFERKLQLVGVGYKAAVSRPTCCRRRAADGSWRTSGWRTCPIRR